MHLGRESLVNDCDEQAKLIEEVSALLMRSDFAELLMQSAGSAGAGGEILTDFEADHMKVATNVPAYSSSQNLRMLLEEPNFDHAVNYHELVKQKQLELDSLTDQFGRASQKFLQELEHSIDTCEIEGSSGHAVHVEKDLVCGQHLRKRTMKMVMKRQNPDGPQSVTTTLS